MIMIQGVDEDGDGDDTKGRWEGKKIKKSISIQIGYKKDNRWCSRRFDIFGNRRLSLRSCTRTERVAFGPRGLP
jgi:hypothetical protein